MSRSRITILAAAVILCGLVATAEAQSRQRRSRAVQSRTATTTQATRLNSATRFTISGQNQVAVRLPDLQIVRVSPDQDGSPPQKITVVNGGGLTAASYDLRMTVLNAYGQTIYQIEISRPYSLRAGASTTFQLPNTGAGASWSLRLDPKNRVREGNEKNNFWANSRER
jgi:hypothetical protein